MKLGFALAAAAGLLVAPAAIAQVTCDDLTRAMYEADNDFDDILGDEIDIDWYEATFLMTGTRDCTVEYPDDSYYVCTWTYDNLSASQSAYDRLASAGRSCLSSWDVKTIPSGSRNSLGFQTIAGLRFVGSGEFRDMEWSFLLGEHTTKDGTHYDVEAELAYFWF